MSLFGNKSLANNNNVNDDDDSIEDDVTTCYYPNEIIGDYEANENEDEIFPYNDKKKYGYRSWESHTFLDCKSFPKQSTFQ
ncbi:19553_t:CDS:2 [Entrophospora sp. SA101]|nr:19553_t:CDS:2 [Entrophospora sp. SA101]